MSKETRLLQRKKDLLAKIETLRGWIFGNHITPYFDQARKMQEGVNNKTYTAATYATDFKKLKQLQANMDKQSKIQMDAKSMSRLVEMDFELREINNELYYIELQKNRNS